MCSTYSTGWPARPASSASRHQPRASHFRDVRVIVAREHRRQTARILSACSAIYTRLQPAPRARVCAAPCAAVFALRGSRRAAAWRPSRLSVCAQLQAPLAAGPAPLDSSCSASGFARRSLACMPRRLAAAARRALLGSRCRALRRRAEVGGVRVSRQPQWALLRSSSGPGCGCACCVPCCDRLRCPRCIRRSRLGELWLRLRFERCGCDQPRHKHRGGLLEQVRRRRASARTAGVGTPVTARRARSLWQWLGWLRLAGAGGRRAASRCRMTRAMAAAGRRGLGWSLRRRSRRPRVQQVECCLASLGTRRRSGSGHVAQESGAGGDRWAAFCGGGRRRGAALRRGRTACCAGRAIGRRCTHGRRPTACAADTSASGLPARACSAHWPASHHAHSLPVAPVGASQAEVPWADTDGLLQATCCALQSRTGALRLCKAGHQSGERPVGQQLAQPARARARGALRGGHPRALQRLRDTLPASHRRSTPVSDTSQRQRPRMSVIT